MGGACRVAGCVCARLDPMSLLVPWPWAPQPDGTRTDVHAHRDDSKLCGYRQSIMT
jgi:hypothetical protein